MIIGKVPFRGDSPISIALQHINDEIEFTSEEQINIPQSVRTIIKKLTEKSSVDRYQSAEEVIEDIEYIEKNIDLDFIKEYDNYVTKNIDIKDLNKQINIEKNRHDEEVVYDDEDDDDYYEDDFEDDIDEAEERSLLAEEERRQRRSERKNSRRSSYEEDEPEPQPAPEPRRTSVRTASNKVVPIRTTARGLEVCICKPKNFGDSTDACEMLLQGRAVVVNLEGIDIMEAQRIMDFISGCIFAISGKMHQISRYIFIFSPESVDISGDYLELSRDDEFGIPTLNKEF